MTLPDVRGVDDICIYIYIYTYMYIYIRYIHIIIYTYASVDAIHATGWECVDLMIRWAFLNHINTNIHSHKCICKRMLCV